ncbi:hypothetical protein Aph01nite_22450 [Acrocarpospora phusangensis]|uniref:Uncharacterized protein n=1 Tax=Acrocarpospora phusangensis TaxID=1070424 RepID=A0A919QC61_9ACTN|nr:hypothetical protein Aph01nite_22450 [Acrocarpospora phusangensis]
MNDVPGLAQVISERGDTRREPQYVMKQNDGRHISPIITSNTNDPSPQHIQAPPINPGFPTTTSRNPARSRSVASSLTAHRENPELARALGRPKRLYRRPATWRTLTAPA